MHPKNIEFVGPHDLDNLSAYGPARATVPGTPLTDEGARLLDWRTV